MDADAQPRPRKFKDLADLGQGLREERTPQRCRSKYQYHRRDMVFDAANGVLFCCRGAGWRGRKPGAPERQLAALSARCLLHSVQRAPGGHGALGVEQKSRGTAWRVLINATKGAAARAAPELAT